MSVFGEYARYYDLLYRDKDYRGEVAFVKSLLDRHAPKAKTILDLGCGTGRHAAGFVEQGFTVLGVDRSEEMLGRARAIVAALPAPLKGKLEVAAGDVRTFRTERRFDAVLSLFHVASYQTNDEDLRAMFQVASDHLVPGGLFLFDCWYGPTVLAEPPEIRVKRLEDADVALTRIAEPEWRKTEDVVVVNYDIFLREKKNGAITEIRESHLLRYLFEPAVRARLSDEGFDLRASGEWMTDATPSDHTFSVYFAAVKR